MPLTPLDIHNKEFNKGFRGYDEDEVNEFLDQVIKDYELVLREKKEMEERLNDMNERLGHFVTIEDTLNKSIIIAQEAGEDVKRNAQKEAKLIIKEA
ncbi:MAG: DivIVA domain-containing protein, partial [Bacillus sp. (in: firmicutes)]